MPHIHPIAVESSRLLWLLLVVGVTAIAWVVRELYKGHRK